MALELVLRFFLGGILVTAFSTLGETFEPKTFAGIFGAAPSVAIASLALAYSAHDATYVRAEALPMLAGAVALYVYAAACVTAACRERVPVWLSAVSSWVAWFAVAFAIWGLGARAGALR